MTVRDIRFYGDPVLRAPAAPITEIDDGIRSLVQDLLDTTRPEGRAGVAAPQIGVSLQAFSYNVEGRLGYVLNPVVEERSGELAERDEGCLSVPGIWAKAPRYDYARVRGIDLDGNEVVLEGDGFFGQMLQHETDHLRGIVYLEVLSKERRREALRRVRESDWF